MFSSNSKYSDLDEQLEKLRQTGLSAPEETYRHLLVLARDLIPTIYCSVLYLLDKGSNPHELYVTKEIYADPPAIAEIVQPVQSGQGVGGYIVREGRIIVKDVSLHPIGPGSSGGKSLSNNFVRQQGIKSYVGLRLGEVNNPFGILYLNWLEPREFLPDELVQLDEFARKIGALVENIRSRAAIELTRLETKQFDSLLSSLSDRRTNIDLTEQIEKLLKHLTNHQSNPKVFLRYPKGEWRRFEIDETRGFFVSQLSINADKRQLGILKQLLTVFQKQNDDKSLVLQDGNNDFADDVPKVWKNGFGTQFSHFVASSIRVGGNCVGLVVFELNLTIISGHSIRHSPTVARIKSLLNRFSRQLSIIVQQYDTTNILVSLRELSNDLATNHNLHVIATEIASQIVQNIRLVDAITIYYRSELDNEIIHYAQYGVENTDPLAHFPPFDDDSIFQLLKRKTPLFGDPALVDNKFCRQERFLTSAAFPLRRFSEENASSENLGIMFFNYRARHSFDDEEMNILRLYAQNAESSLNRAYQYQAAERERRHLRLVKELALALKSLNPDDVIRTILTCLQQEFASVAHNFALVEYDKQRNLLVIAPVNFVFYKPDKPPPVGYSYFVDASRNLGLSGKLIVESDKGVDYVLATHIKSKTPKDYISAIRSTNSQLTVRVSDQAALVVESDFPDPFNYKEHISLLRLIADYAAIALQKAQDYHGTGQKWRAEIAVLASGLIHDIGGIMGAIPAAINEIKMSDVSGCFDSITEPIARIEAAVDKTYGINGRIKEFLQTQEFRMEKTRLKSIVEAGIEAAEDARDPSIETRVKPSHMSTTIIVDKGWMELLFKNILQNAYRAVKRNTGTGFVEISVKKIEQRLKIYVRDTGIGIPRDKWERVFEPLYVADQRDDDLLHGIGLFYCRELAEAHEGSLYVHNSVVGKGTTMCLEIPLSVTYRRTTVVNT